MANTIFDSSVFAKYFTTSDPAMLAWLNNVLAKLRSDGIIAKFIDKGDTESSDSDFNQYCYPLVKTSAYIVRLAREFESFRNNDQLANNYLTAKGYYPSGNEIINWKNTWISNGLRISGERGGINMIAKAGESNKTINGEVLSLLNWDSGSFVKFGVPRPQYNSWNIGNSSPLYRGTEGRQDLILGYEYTQEVQSLGVYPLLNSSYIKITTYKGKRCMEIEGTPLGQNSGIGASDLSKKIVINPNHNFSIKAKVAQDINALNITFGVKMFDAFDNPISAVSAVDGSPTDFFFTNKRLNKVGKFYHLEGILFNRFQSNLSAEDGTLSVGFGEHLRFPEGAVSIIPYLVYDNDLSGGSDSDSGGNWILLDGFWDDTGVWVDSAFWIDEVGGESDSGDGSTYDGSPSIYIYDFSVMPTSTRYGRCYINNKNFIDIFATTSNQNGEYNNDQIRDILRKYFIPYNTAFDIVDIPLNSTSGTDDVDNILLESGDDMLFEDTGLILLEIQS
jgi:hypothetical protein